MMKPRGLPHTMVLAQRVEDRNDAIGQAQFQMAQLRWDVI